MPAPGPFGPASGRRFPSGLAEGDREALLCRDCAEGGSRVQHEPARLVAEVKAHADVSGAGPEVR